MSGVVEQVSAIYREHAPELKAYLLRLGCPAPWVEDIVQEGFYRALKYQAVPFRRIDNLRAWLYRTVYNIYIDSRRRSSRERALAQESMEDNGAGPAEMVLDREQQDMARVALDRVPERQKNAVLLCDISGLTYGEAAEVLGTGPGTIRGLLYRGRMRLREEYRRLEGGDKGE